MGAKSAAVSLALEISCVVTKSRVALKTIALVIHCGRKFFRCNEGQQCFISILLSPAILLVTDALYMLYSCGGAY